MEQKLAEMTPTECDWRFTARHEFVGGKWRCMCGFNGRRIQGLNPFTRTPLAPFHNKFEADFHGIDCSEQRGPLAALPSSTMPNDVTHRIPLQDGRIFAFSNMDTACKNPALYEIDSATLEVKQLSSNGRPGFHEATEELEKYHIVAGCPNVLGVKNQLYLSSPVAMGTNIYFVGGQKMHVYDVDAPERGFLDAGTLPDIRLDPAVAFFGTKIYVAGGLKRNGVQSYGTWCEQTWISHATIIVYDTAADTQTWNTLSSKLTLNKGLSRMAWCSDATRLYLLGGRRETWTTGGSNPIFDSDITKLTSAMMINSEDDVVSSLPSMPGGREWYSQIDMTHSGSACAIMGDVIYVGGGVYSHDISTYGTEIKPAPTGYKWWYGPVATGAILSFNLTSQTWSKESGSSALDYMDHWAGPCNWRLGSNNPSVSSYGKASSASLMTSGKRLWMTVEDFTGGVMYEPEWTPSQGSA